MRISFSKGLVCDQVGALSGTPRKVNQMMQHTFEMNMRVLRLFDPLNYYLLFVLIQSCVVVNAMIYWFR